MIEDDDYSLFLKPDTYETGRPYIDVLPSAGLTEDYMPVERFLSRCSGDREAIFASYGGSQLETLRPHGGSGHNDIRRSRSVQ